ncbi:uncharacterized protein LOC143913923 [Arctopsyche grandis]|uniref:uncharacterized protein LOC143913923 n=1 Tax=Arctopsyche grandis TaxID=121162 RepID=UPI00406D79C6
MSGMSGGSMLRTRRKDANVKPNRRLDRKSSRGMLYENEELRLRTININAEVERGQSDIKKLKRENEQLRREVGALRGEYDRLERLLKARHQQDNSDAEGSGSCCSDCESECCNTQNNVNAASDVKKKCCRDDKVVETVCCKDESEGSCSMAGCGVSTCGKLSAVPEESILRVPYTQQQNLQACNCQIPPCIINADNPAPVQDYYTAVVTVPMASHLPDSQNIQLTASDIYPKTGLDILINNNNNAFEHFQGFTVSPPIGFIIPPQSNLHDSHESYQIVPNVDFENIRNVENLNTPSTGNEIQNGGNIEDLLNDFGPDCSKDSYFVCNTKKIIQQMTVQNTNIISTINCNCNTSSNKDLSNPDIIIVSSNAEAIDKPSFITEKNIELNYDYPKSVLNNVKDENQSPMLRCEETKSHDITQTTHTTTEVNTVMMFGRKKKSKENKFGRSHSAPVEPLSDEPIYATVQKLPKNLKRLHIRKLENEIKYIPPEDSEKEDDIVAELPNNNNNMSNIKDSDSESIDGGTKSNGVLPKVKLDSFSESSDKNETNARNSISKSPIIRKKKRFSIHFKRKNKKLNEKKIAESTETSDDIKNIEENKNKSDSDRLIEQSSSVESHDNTKLKDSSPTFICKKHKKLRQMSRHDSFKNKQCPLNYDNHNGHQCDKCSAHKKQGGRTCERVKKSCSPVRNYFKNDSYQEITTSHSERERTNSLSSSGHSGFSLATNKSRKMSATRTDDNIPWCGCWGNSCL